jgi:hypothetical protein
VHTPSPEQSTSHAKSIGHWIGSWQGWSGRHAIWHSLSTQPSLQIAGQSIVGAGSSMGAQASGAWPKQPSKGSAPRSEDARVWDATVRVSRMNLSPS